MSNALDYLQWRGDLSFLRDPLNVIDTLIFSLLSYLPFTEIIPGIESKDDISLQEAASRYFAKHGNSDKQSPHFNPTASPELDSELVALLKKAANCTRFQNVRLSDFEENTDFVIGQQFAAVTFTLNNWKHEKVVAFRGTDNSFIGWKEDFELAYMEKTPAQESAYCYLERLIGFFSSPVTVCGHSKGGNLAMFAGAHLTDFRQNKIAKIINFDGPGFDFSVVDQTPFLNCEHKIVNYLPDESIVGLLLTPVGKRTIVSSLGRSINQHNALNWKVNRTELIPGNLTSAAKLLDQTLKTWLAEMPLAERKIFIEALFDILGASEGAAITFSPQENLKEIKNILVKHSKLDHETKEVLTQVFIALRNQTRKALSTTIKEKLPKIKRPQINNLDFPH